MTRFLNILADLAVSALVPEPVTTVGVLVLGSLGAWGKLKSQRKTGTPTAAPPGA